MESELHYWCKLLVSIAIVSCASSAAIGNNELETRGRGDVTAYVASMSLSVDSTTVTGSKLFDTNLVCTVVALNSSDRIPSNDRANWKLGIFGSDNRGNRKKEVTQILPRAQRGLPMFPGEELTFWVATQLNLKGIGSGTDYPYLCTELSKADSNEDFEFPQGSFISCVKFTPPDGNTGGGGESGGLQVLVSRFGLQLTTTPGQSQIGVAATIELRNDTDLVPDAQFRLGIFGSKKKSGSKRRLNEIRQILPPEDTTHPVYAGRNVEINVETEYDLEDPRFGANFPFVCVELERLNVDANFDIPTTTETGTLITCLLHGYTVHLPVISPQIPARLPEISVNVRLNRLAFRIVPNTTLLDVDVTYQVHPHRDSDPIPPGETANWRLGIYGSPGPDSDDRWKEVTQILSPKQQRLPMNPGQRVTFDVTSTGLDLTGIGTGTDYPFICVEFAKADIYDRNFVFRRSHSCCSRASNVDAFDYINNYVYPTPDPGLGDGPRTEVILDQDARVYQMETTNLRFDVVISEYTTPNPVYGTSLWFLKVWASGEKDGSGPKYGASRSMLQGQGMMWGEVPRTVSFNDYFINVDLTGVECDAVKYLCAEAELILGPPLTGCTRLKCEKRHSRAERSIELPETSKADDGWEEVVGSGTGVDFFGSKSPTLLEGFTFWRNEPDANDTIDNVDQSLAPDNKDD